VPASIKCLQAQHSSRSRIGSSDSSKDWTHCDTKGVLKVTISTGVSSVYCWLLLNAGAVCYSSSMHTTQAARLLLCAMALLILVRRVLTMMARSDVGTYGNVAFWFQAVTLAAAGCMHTACGEADTAAEG
jgi:hypothetical protein